MPTQTGAEYWLALRADGSPGTGKPNDPFDVSSPSLFAATMNSFDANSTIHLGPGIFQVPAVLLGGAQTWPRSGQKIVGAGMYATTLKVVGATSQNPLSFGIVVGVSPNDFLDGFEASDFTVDCNMRGHIGTGVAIGGIAIFGRRVRLRRIRAIDFGTEDGLTQGVECFVIGSGFAHPDARETYNCTIENCLIEKPYKNGVYNSTCMILGSGESASGGIAYHRAGVVRNCLINCEYLDSPVPISAITFSGSTATVTTKIPHIRRINEWFTVTGALENSVPSVHFNGSFLVTAVVDAFQLQYTFFAGDAQTYPPTSAPVQPTGDMWIGKTSSDIVGIKFTVPNPDPDPYNPGQQGVSVQQSGGQWIVTLVTDRPHLRVLGDNVKPIAVTVGGNESALLNRLFPISEVVNPAKLRFVISTNPGAPDPGQPARAQINPGFVGISADGGVGTVVENNRVYNTRAGFYHDTFATRDLVVRKNCFVAVAIGIYQAMGGATRRFGSSLIRNGTTAIFTSQKPHGLNTNQTVVISGAVVNGSYSNVFNGSYQITKLSNTSFQYTMPSDPGANASGSPVFTTPLTAVSLVRELSDPLVPKAIFTTSSAHGFQVNDFVSVFDAMINSSIANSFNGAFQIVAVTTSSPYTFTYKIAGDPGANASGTPKCAMATACPLVNSGLIATFTTPFRHTLEVGQGILVTGAADPSVAGSGYFEGGFEILSVPSPTTLSYTMSGTPAGNAAPSVEITSLWQVGRQILERNIIELILSSLKSGYGPSAGVTLSARIDVPIPPYVFRQALIRGNIIRTMENAVDPHPGIWGVFVSSCENSTVECNVINLSRATPLLHYYSGSIKYFNNQSPRGSLIQGAFNPADPLSPQPINELTTDADVGLTSSL